jgi:hypothetical protein
MVGLSNDGTGLSLGGSLSLGKNGLALNTDGTTLYGQGLTLLGAVPSAVALWATAVAANGGSVSTARLAIVSTFVVAEQASGAWYLTDDYMPLWGENAPQALTSLKQRRLAVAVNSPTFAADRGYAFNGTTQYLNTGFIPSTNGINCTGTNQRIGVYERTNVNSVGLSAGVLDAAGRNLTLNNRTGTTATARANGLTASFTLGTTDSRGLKAASRAGGSSTVKLFDRGVKLTDATVAAGTAAPTRAIYVGCYNNAGTAASFRASSVGFVVVGGPLSDAQELAQYNAIQAWATSVGANV